MSAEQLLSELRALDVRLSVDDGHLHCNAPKGRLTPDLQQRIAAHKPDLIRALRAAAPQPVAIPRRSVDMAGLPLSFAQERLWFLQNLDPESTAYNLTAHQRVPARVDASALEASLRATLQRHEILRTNFRELEGAPIQIVREESSVDLAIYDLAEVPEPDRLAAVEAMLRRLSRSRFDLARDPLLRAALIRLDEQDHLVVLTMHHIVCDGWSIGILFSDLKSFYGSYSGGGPVRLPELPIQFGDYVVWERDRQTSSILEPQIEYWKKKLEGGSQHLDLPLDRMRPAFAGSEAGLHRFQLDASTSESLKRIAHQEGATLFMTLLAVFKALLFRYAGQSDIVVGTPVSTRTQPELEQLIGCFINTLVLRTEVRAAATARQLLARVRDTVLESLHNADVPFETLVNKLPTERDLSRSPLFQIAFILQNTALSSEYQVTSGGTALDLTLYVWESEGRIGGSVEYNLDLFNAGTIARFAACYCTLAAEMASQPDSPISRLPLLTKAQEAEWLEAYHDPRIWYPQDLCTHEWIERQACETPDAIAVVCGEEQLTYRELSVRSNRLAHRLRALGVGPESLVGLCVDRSLDLVIAPLAIWKAGGAYVPLDPEYPSQRLAFMLEDSGAAVLVTESRFLSKLRQTLPAVVCLDRERRRLEEESAEAPLPAATAENLAYVIYTSGSTGKPKGVEIRHRSLVNLLWSMQREPGIGAADRLLAVTTFSFDIAGLELYLPLVSGAQVVIAPRAAAFDGEALAKLLADSGISMMQATPVTWRLLLEAGWRGSPGLKILCGGEALTLELAQRLLGKGAEVWNLYGPTETTIWSTLQRIEAGCARVPIGHPIANTQVYVRDEYGQPVPPGVTGELYIGGAGLARGYLHRAELTAERFVEHPFQPGQRLYRTGDLVRRLADGSLECLARVDHQVKLRGFRIELGEIEKALEQQPGIGQAVVVVREDTAGDPRLTAYLTGSAPDAAALRKALQASLPDYMVPAAFVPLDHFPLTPNRKVDRQALPAPPAEAAALTAHLSPRTRTESEVAAIWRDLLRNPRVGVNDNFFDLGGHSLLVVQLQSRLRRQFKREISLVDLFQHPTIAMIAGLLGEQSPLAEHSTLVGSN
jgi:amino acid adenylation domain-containing protein